jgi:hypothetical protein
MVNYITVDAATAARLHQARDVVAVRDESGEVLGYFAPTQRAAGTPMVPDFREEDLQQWESEPGGRTLKEIMADLSNMP